MTITKIPSQKTCYTYDHGYLLWSWSSGSTRPYPQYGWDFLEEISEKIRKDLRNTLRVLLGIFLKSAAGNRPNPVIQGIWSLQSVSSILSPLVRLGTALFSEVVLQRAPRSWPWNSQQYWAGRTPKGPYSSRGRSRHLLETAFSEPLLRTLLRTLFYCKTHSKPPSQNPSENPFLRTLPRTFSEPFLERCVAVRPLRRAPNWGHFLKYSFRNGRSERCPKHPAVLKIIRDLGCCGPGKLPEKRKFPKVDRRGCKRSFGPCEQEASCTGAKWGCTGAKEGLGGAKDSWETFAPWAQKESKRPFAP